MRLLTYAEDLSGLTSLDTSKHESPAPIHGRNGSFLPSLAALSTLTITSHHHAHRSLATLILHHSRPAARLVPAPAHHQLSNREHGTRVNVQDLFGNMPVRVKQRGMLFGAGGEDEKQMGLLQKQVVGHLLAWDVPVMVTLRSTGSAKKLIVRGKGSSNEELRIPSSHMAYDLSLTRSILSQAAYIDPSEWDTWIKTSARTPFITIQGGISLQPGPSKQVQFIALGVHYLDPEFGGNELYDEVNRLFASSSFGKQEDVLGSEGQERRNKDRRFKQDGFTNKQLKGSGRGIDKWPRFSLRIEFHNDGNLPRNVYAALRRESNLSSLLKVLGALINGFLKDHYFRPRARSSGKNTRLLNQSSASASPHRLRSSHSQTTLGVKISKAQITRPLGSLSPLVPEPESPADLSLVEQSLPKKICDRQIGCIPIGDDFGGSVKLPSFSRNHDSQLDEWPNSWSRTKSGRLKGTYDEFSGLIPVPRARLQASKPSAPTHTSTPTEHFKGGQGDAKPRKGSPTATDCSDSISESCHDVPALDDPFIEDDSTQDSTSTGETETCETTPETEKTFTWVNPVSKTRVLVNARTGLTIPQLPTKPYSAGTNASSQPPANQYPKQAIVLKGQKRLIHKPSAHFSTLEPGSWIGNLFKNWENPVFKPEEERIPQVSFDLPVIESSDISRDRRSQCSHNNIHKAFTEASLSVSTRLSKESLSRARIIAQVDKKFILVHMDASSASKDIEHSKSTGEQLLVLIDQHAADERIRVERLFADLCEAATSETRAIRSSLSLRSAIGTTLLQKPISFDIQPREHQLFISHSNHFANWGILFDLNAPLSGPTAVESPTCKLVVRTLPAAIAERCRIDSKILIELMRGEVWRQEEPGFKTKVQPPAPLSSPSAIDPTWLSKISSCPPAILDMLNSRSCRSAIMFNDVLTVDECKTLIAKLADCVFPFQCAHGRPSMVPLVDLGKAECLGMGWSGRDDQNGGRGFGKEWRRWRGDNEQIAE